MFNIGVQQVIPCLIFRNFLSIPKKLAPTTALPRASSALPHLPEHSPYCVRLILLSFKIRA